MHLGVRAGFAGGKKPDAKKPGTALVIPKPINLPSRRKENNGFDPSIQLVPGGSAGSWMGPGGRPGVALPAGMPVGAGSYMGQQLAGRAAPGQAGTLAAGAPRTSGPPAGWGAAPTANSAAAVSGAGRTGDFPELGGPSRPANIWKAPAAAAPSDDRTVALRKPSREGRGGNGRDWAEDDEEEPMDFRRPVVIERDSSHANTAGASSSSSSSMVSTSPSAATKPPDAVNVMQRADPREEARILALKKQKELEKMQEQLHEQQRRQEKEAEEKMMRQEQQEQERRRKEIEDQRMAQEEQRRRAMEQADERRRIEQERRLYEERERTWQDEQRRRVEEQRRQQQDQYGGQDEVKSRILAQENTMRQASEAAKLRRQQEEERERESARAARMRLEELDRRRGDRVGPSGLGGDAILRQGGGGQGGAGQTRSAWGSTESASGTGGVVGFGGGQEADYSSMNRGRGADPKGPRKLYDHKAGKFVSEDQEAWKGINRPPTADKGAVKGGDKSRSDSSSGANARDARGGQQAIATGGGAGGIKEQEGMSRAELKKLALEERRRRERDGKTSGDDDDFPGTLESKAADKNGPKRLLTRDNERGRNGAVGRQTAGGIVGTDSGASVHGVGGNSWMAGLSGGLGSEVDALATSSAWKLSENAFGGGGGTMDASLGLHDGDMGDMFRMGDTNDVATGAADFILEGDDEPASGMQELSDGGEESLLEHSFNAPAGWAPASSRAGWGGEAGTGAGAWDLSQGLSQGSSVNIEKAFGAFNGVGNNSVLGGLAYGIPASKSNLVWSGSMMGIGDLANDWQLNNEGDENAGLRMPQGWSAPPPDSFASVGDVGGESQRSGHPDRDKGRGGRNKPRDPKGGGGGGRGGQKSRAVDPSADWSSKSSENGDPDAGANIAARGGRSVGRQQSANAQSRNKRGGERGGRPSSAYAEGLGAVPKLEGADKAMEGEGGSRVGGRSSRGKARGSASRPAMLAVPENIRLAAQDMVKQSQEGPPP